MTSKMCIVLTTVASQDDAESLAGMLLERRLAACTQQFAVASRFRWNGAVQTASEVLVLVKTAADRVNEAMAAIREHHNYDLPEIVSIPVNSGLPAYVDWVLAATRYE